MLTPLSPPQRSYDCFLLVEYRFEYTWESAEGIAIYRHLTLCDHNNLCGGESVNTELRNEMSDRSIRNGSGEKLPFDP